ncbi:hypothetical protein EXU57_20250 [Segetibacter sp. 3557_3]|uniref:hypothetical protein n=1 Tax=Segetibacter sp. 3557_3 TaxID=2547429 RepID=UPI001059020E|nr:hypothetical protein [Segetibacter sp. 3557_3]TDH21275.1 hypothetical protein EXU57_20250 [Segetibacter sp. 3557_3]
MKRLFLLGVTILSVTLLFSSCSKDVETGTTGNTGTPKTQITAPFAGNWSSNSVGLITYWQQGSYNGSYGNTVNTVHLGSDGTAGYYGYYEGAYSTTFFYHYKCTAASKQEADGSTTITLYPYGGEQIIGTTKKAIAASSLYPNKLIVLKNCQVVTSNGKTFIQYYMGNETGSVSSTVSSLERHS